MFCNRPLGALAVLALLLGGSALVAPAALGAEGVELVITSPDPLPPGGTVMATGSGCEPSEAVHWKLWSTSGGPRVTGSTAAGAAGEFAITEPLDGRFGEGDRLGLAVFCGGTMADPERLEDAKQFFYVALTVAPDASLALSDDHQVYGSPGTAKATFTPPTASGVARIIIDGKLVAQTAARGEASFTLPTDLPPGQHQVKVTFKAFAYASEVESPAGTLTVTKAATSTALSLSKPSWRYGSKSVLAKARVTGVSAGLIQFRLAGKKVGKPVAVVRGTAALRLPKTKVGRHTLSAAFHATSTHAGSTATAKVKVTKAIAKVKVKVKLATSSVRAGATVKVKVTVTAKGIKSPRGKLVVYDGKKKVKTASLKKKHRGKLTVKLGGLRATGKHKLTVRYQGAAQIKAARSKAVIVRVAR